MEFKRDVVNVEDYLEEQKHRMYEFIISKLQLINQESKHSVEKVKRVCEKWRGRNIDPNVDRISD